MKDERRSLRINEYMVNCNMPGRDDCHCDGCHESQPSAQSTLIILPRCGGSQYDHRCLSSHSSMLALTAVITAWP